MEPQETITLPNLPNTPRGKGKLVAAAIGILILIGAVVVGIVLVQQRQLLNQQASVGPGECGQAGVTCQVGTSCQNGICAPIATPTASVCGGACTTDADCAKSSGLGFQPICNANKQCANPSCANNTQPGTICACETNFGSIACGDPCGAQTSGAVLPITCANGGVCGNSANGGDGNNYCLPANGSNPNYVTKGGICAKDPNTAVFCINKSDGTHVTTQAEIKQAACPAPATATPIASATPTATPVVSSSPNPTATPSPTAAPRVSIPATNVPVPVTGDSTPTIIGMAIGIFLIIGSLVLLI